MNSRLAVVFAALALLISCEVVAQVQATLIIPDRKVLPGVPFDMWINVVNPTDASVGVGLCPSFIVKRNGESYTIAGKRNGHFDALLSDTKNPRIPYLVLKPREQRTLTLPIRPDLIGASLFDDDRFLGPGNYVLSVRLDFCWCGLCEPQETPLPPDFRGPITTNEVAVKRVTPAGSDAAVWARLQELAAHGTAIASVWQSYSFLNEVVSNHPDSGYVPYALVAGPFGNNRAEYRERVRAAIARFPGTPVREYLQAYVGTPTERPTTRVVVLGRQDAPPPPWPDSHPPAPPPLWPDSHP